MKRSKFNLSHTKLLTCNQGQLVPIGLTEVLPGDSFQHHVNCLVRTNPLLAPVMHPVEMRIHHWFVPHRLTWENWEDFITGGEDGFNASVFPTITMPAVTGATIGSLADYLGVPTGVASLEVSALPFRAAALIWNEWYRDQDLQTKIPVSLADGPDSTTSTALKNVAWEKDYFTIARPWTQKGPDVTVPLGDTAPVTTNDEFPTFNGTGVSAKRLQGRSATSPNVEIESGFSSDTFLKFGAQSGLQADLADATAASINELRRAFAIQRYEEARARYGSRYTEYLRYLGVKSSDARLQRPEYLGGGRQTLQFSEVLQTSPTTDGDDEVGVGNLKGHGIGALKSNTYRRFFEEHGYVISFISTKPKTMYVQGLPRTWNRRTKEDFWQRELQHIGQQEVLTKEIYAASATPNATWGYSDRYAEYRSMESTIAGEFRDTLDFWHMARIFGSEPALNGSFVESNPTDRIYSVTSTDQLYVMARHRLAARRLVDGSNASYIY